MCVHLFIYWLKIVFDFFACFVVIFLHMKTMNKGMTKQQIFTKVKNHLLTQNSKAVDQAGMCVYLARDGTRCAIGSLLEEADAMRLTLPIIRLMEQGEPAAVALLPTDLTDTESGIEFLQHLQGVHDKGDVLHWGEMLKVFADEYNLTY